jgi:hypothetical protein
LIALDRNEVMPAVGDPLRTHITLAERCVAGDHAALQRQILEQAQRGLVLVGLGADLGLPQGQAALLGHRREQVHGPLMATEAAAHRLAVQGDRFEPGAAVGRRPGLGRYGLRPARQGRLERHGIEGGEQLAEGPPLRRRAGEAQGMHQGDVLVVDPLGDRLEAAGAAEDGAAHGGEHRRKRVAAAMGRTGVGDGREMRDQRSR